MGQQLALQDELQRTLALRRHGSVLAPLRIVSSQWRHGRLLLFMVALGMLVAVGIASAVPIYVNLAPDAQLQVALVRAPAETNIEVTAVSPTVDPNTAQTLNSQISTLGEQGLTAFAPTSMNYVSMQDPVPMADVNGAPPAKASPTLERAYALVLAYTLADALPHMRLISGSLPRDDASLALPDVLMTPQSGLKAGDIVTLGTRDFSARLRYRVSGIWFPRDERDPYWNGRSFLVSEYAKDKAPPPVFPLLVSPAGFYSSLGALQPSPGMIVHHVFLTRPTLLNAHNAAESIGAIEHYRASMAYEVTGGNVVTALFTTRVSLATRLDAIIEAVQRQFALLELPLDVVVSQVLGLTLLFILVISALLVESHAAEIAVLKSRGASSTQVVLGFALQGVLLGALAALAGLFIAVAVNVFLVRQSVAGASGLSVNYLAEASNLLGALRPAVAVAALCVVAVVIPAALAMRRDVLAFRQEVGRTSRAPFWRRYYLDIALALAAVAGYIELGQFGGFGVRSQLASTASGGASVVMLVAPGLLLLAGALVMLRCLPLVSRAGVRLASRMRGPVGLLSFAQIARGSGTYTMLMLLLTLTVSLSLFALTFQSSLGRNTADRAAYVTGGDKRVTISDTLEGTGQVAQIQQQMQRLPGVTAMTPLIRGRGSVAPNFGTLDAQLLGIDPATFAQAAYWRDDYAATPLATLLAQMRQHAGAAGVGQPDVPIWALVSPGFADALNLQVGTRFTLTPQVSVATTVEYVVGAILNNFPTLYEGDGYDYIVVDSADLVAGMDGIGESALLNGPNEYWLRTTGRFSDEVALAEALSSSSLFVNTVTDRRTLARKFADDPLSAGMIGLLLGGAALCALLAVLGSVVQSATSARRRVVQFAVLRTLGVAREELTRILLGEQLIIYLFGLAGGTLIGLVLASATLPYLTFDSAVADPGAAGVPPPVLAFSAPALLLFYAALLLAFLLALAWQRRSATHGGLGKLLRLGED
jgi:ABC-type lipoprotein release transport system permease subunit